MLAISRETSEQLRSHARDAFPEECCGILLGRVVEAERREVSAAIPCRNTHPQPRTHYLLDSRDLIAAQRDAREQGRAIVGFYHSHPAHPAEASPTDQAEALWVGCSYVVVGVAEGGGTKMESYACVGEQILVPEALEII